MVWKMYLLSNVAILGICVGFQAGRLRSTFMDLCDVRMRGNPYPSTVSRQSICFEKPVYTEIPKCFFPPLQVHALQTKTKGNKKWGDIPNSLPISFPREKSTIYCTPSKKTNECPLKSSHFKRKNFENHYFSGANCQFQGGYNLFPLSS